MEKSCAFLIMLKTELFLGVWDLQPMWTLTRSLLGSLIINYGSSGEL